MKPNTHMLKEPKTTGALHAWLAEIGRKGGKAGNGSAERRRICSEAGKASAAARRARQAGK